MVKRRFNWKLALVLVFSIAIFGISTYLLRGYQRARMAYGGLAKGNKAYAKGLWEQAARNLGRYLAVMPGDVQILAKYADAQLKIRPLKQANIQHAIAAYRSILRIDRANHSAAENLINLYLQMNIASEAELIATGFLKTNQDTEIRTLLATAMIKQRKFKQAAAELQSIIDKHPEQIPAYEIMARLCEYRPDNFSHSPEHWYDEAIKHNRSCALAYIIRGAFYLRANDIHKASSDLEQAEKQDLSDWLAELRLAEEFIKVGALDKAQKHLAAVQAANPANPVLWHNWAVLALKSKSKEQMLKTAEDGLKQLACQPWDFMPLAAELFILSGEFEQAKHCIGQLRQKDIAPEKIAFLEGLLADRKGQHHQAVKHWRQAIQLGNNSPKVRLFLADALSRWGDKCSAIQQLRRLVSEQPRLLQGHLKLARMLSRAGRWAESVEQAKIVLQTSPEDPDAALLDIQGRVQLFMKNQTAEDAPEWLDIEKRLAQLESKTEIASAIKLLQFQLALHHKKLIRAEQLLAELKTTYPAQLDVAIAEAQLLRAEGNFDEAAVQLRQTIDEFPQSARPVSHLAALLDNQNKPEACENIIINAIERIKQPETKRELGLLLNNLYHRWGKKDKPYKLLKSLACELPADIPIKRQLLNCQQQIANSDEAQQIVDQIKELEGQGGWQWRYEQAKLWLVSEKFDDHYPQLISLLEENLNAVPDSQANRLLLAVAHEKAGQFQLAIRAYRDTLDRWPYNIPLIVSAVAAMYKAKQYDQADEILDYAAKAKLYNPQLAKLQMQSHLRGARLEPAIEILKTLIKTDPNDRAMRLSLALLNIRQNKLDEAQKLLVKLSTEEPNSLPIAAGQAELYIRQGKTQQALDFYDTLVARFNNAQAHIGRGKVRFLLGRISQAEEDFNKATTIEPNNSQAWVAKTDFYRLIGQGTAACDSIQKALSIEPANLRIQKRAAPLLLASNDRKIVTQGKNLLEKALATNPADIELLVYKARFLLKQQTAPAIEQAVNILEKITHQHPEIIDSWVLLAESALRQGRAGKAMDVLLQGLTYSPNNKALLLLKARIEGARSPALAILTLKHLCKLGPNDIDTAIELSRIFIEAGDANEAINLLESRLAFCNASDRKRLSIALAEALYKSGNRNEAEKKLDSLYESWPDDPQLLLAQVRLLKYEQHFDQLMKKVAGWYQKHPEEASSCIAIAKMLAVDKEDSKARETAEVVLEMVLDSNPNCTEAMMLLATLLQISGRSERSAQLYERILERDPNNVVAINNLAWLLCEYQHKYQKALELAEQGLAIAPNYADLIDTHAVACHRLGRFNDAVKELTRCLKLYPSRAPATAASHFHLGRALAKLGRKNQAIEKLKYSLELNAQIGSLSSTELAQAQRLLSELLKEPNHAKLTN